MTGWKGLAASAVAVVPNDVRDVDPYCRDREPLLNRLGHGVVAQPHERRRICRARGVGVGVGEGVGAGVVV